MKTISKKIVLVGLLAVTALATQEAGAFSSSSMFAMAAKTGLIRCLNFDHMKCICSNFWNDFYKNFIDGHWQKSIGGDLDNRWSREIKGNCRQCSYAKNCKLLHSDNMLTRLCRKLFYSPCLDPIQVVTLAKNMKKKIVDIEKI